MSVRSSPDFYTLLAKQAPRIKGRPPGEALINGTDVVAAAVDTVRRLDSSYLPIQGPPGTGKTYVASQAILALLRAGKRVAVTSNSHKAIGNLMAAVAARAREQQVSLQAIQKLSNGELPPDPAVEVTRDNDDPRLTTYPLVAGTAWLFARPEHDQQFDYLMVDEAGQVALANIVAVGTAAQNVVLVGDPMQLSQPIQGTQANRAIQVLAMCSTASLQSPRNVAFFFRFRAGCIPSSALMCPTSFMIQDWVETASL